MLANAGTAAGVQISEHNALTVSDVYKCCRVITEAIAMLPCEVYMTNAQGKTKAVDHPLYHLLQCEPNDHMTAFTYLEVMLLNLLLWGRHASYIERGKFGQPVALWPIRPDLFRFEVRDGQMWFYVTTQGGVQTKFWEDEILYIPGLTRDGYFPYSPIALHRETLGLSKATEMYGASFFGNGSHSGGFLSTEGNLSPEAAKRLKDSWEEKNSGMEAAHRVVVLEEGLKFTANTIPPEDAQFLQTRKFQRSEIAGIFRVPPHKIGDLDRSTNNNIEHQDMEFYRDTVAPWATRIEQGMNRRLLMPGEKGKVFIKFDITGMMRGDTAARMAFYLGMFQTGSFGPNDILAAEGFPKVEGGDQRFVPMNMVPLDKAAQLADANASSSKEAVDATKQRIRQANTRFFRDVAGRVVNRESSKRQKYAETAFLQPVLGLIECVLGSISESMRAFAASYSAAIALQTPAWEAEKLDEIVAAEVERCINAVLERGSN
jgi:HK97 family phage portal protein